MSTATITRPASSITDISLDNPKDGTIKFYKPEKTFGFVETNDWDAFFGPRGYRQVRLLSNGKATVEAQPCPEGSLESGLEIVILSARLTPKGVHAIEWAIPSLIVEECVVWTVVQRVERRIEREATSDPVCDNERRMFKTHTTRTVETFINEHIVKSCATKEEAEACVEERTPSYSYRNENGTGTKVSFRVEFLRLA
jgi:hypothetical protein